MNLNRLLTLAMTVGTLVCTSCQSSKIAYGNSYYFKATPRPAAAPSDLSVSRTPVPVPSAPRIQHDFSGKLAEVPAPHQVEERQLTKREVRQARKTQRRAVRKQLKQWLKAGPTNVKEQAKQQVEGFTRIGIIVGAAGAVMLGVGLLAGGNGFLVGLGGILLGIGVVFILIDIL